MHAAVLKGSHNVKAHCSYGDSVLYMLQYNNDSLPRVSSTAFAPTSLAYKAGGGFLLFTIWTAQLTTVKEQWCSQ